MLPVLQLTIESLGEAMQSVDVDAFIDSGAAGSLFNGWIAFSIGLDLFSGERKIYGTTAGHPLETRLHRVRLSHADLGPFELEIGFSIAPIRRNLLGRDFFNLVQIGFRENQLSFFINPDP